MKAFIAKAKAYHLILLAITGEGEDNQDQYFCLERPATPPNLNSEANKRIMHKQDH